MSLVTRGYGNGTFNGTVSEVVLRGYTIGENVIDLVALNATPDLTLKAEINELTLYDSLNTATLQGEA
jgi:hypothetical protein